MAAADVPLPWHAAQPQVDVLVQRAAAGERAALEQLVEQYQDQVYSLALSFSRDPHRAQDLAQEAWIRILRGLPRFRGESRFSTWLYRVATNTFLNQTGGREQPGLPEVEEPVLPTTEADLEVREAVRSLPEEFKAVVALRFGADLSYQEVARVLEVPLGTVQSRLKRAMEKLARLLGGSS